jgi:O-antigen/teichoic acid export membrane protein
LKHKANLISQFIHYAGFTRAVSYGVLGRVWGALAGLLTIAIIASNFSQEKQGFYYAFSSLLAMQMFFELGLTGVIATFSSHEFVKLSWANKGEVKGDQIALERFEDILSKSTKWFGIASLLMVITLIPAGFIFFGKNHGESADILWQFPWILAVIGTSLNMMIVPFFAVIMGSGDVVSINYRGLLGGVLGSLLSWAVILLDGGLYAIFAVTLGNILVSWTYLLTTKPALLKTAFMRLFITKKQTSSYSEISWRNEIWPLQWKIALTWVSGFFIFQLFNPILFHYQGAVVAGKMGMTMSVSNALLSISLVWTNAKVPEFGRLIALRDWVNLDRVFFKVFHQSIVIAVLGAVLGWFCIWVIQMNFQIGQRFLPASQVALLFITSITLIVANGFAIYLRAHKQEPLMVITVITALLQVVSAFVFGKTHSSFGVIIGYLSITLFFSMPAIYLTWKKCRNEWHSI